MICLEHKCNVHVWYYIYRSTVDIKLRAPIRREISQTFNIHLTFTDRVNCFRALITDPLTGGALQGGYRGLWVTPSASIRLEEATTPRGMQY